MRHLNFLILSVFIIGCTSISRTNQLEPGMASNEVEEIMGEPSQTQFFGNKKVWKYSLHQTWKGWVPYYLVFNKESNKLEEWFANEEEYLQKQKLWLQAFPPTQKHDVDINLK